MHARLLWPLVALVALTALLSSPTSGPGPGGRPQAADLPVHADTSTPFNLASLPALIDHEYDGRD
ncbi:MAG: hypothetical protein ACRDOY_03505, partial [Nocardioidaceae bacterium]